MAEKPIEKKRNNKKTSDKKKTNKEKSSENPKKSKKRIILYVIIISIVGILCALVYSVFVNYTKAIPEVIVPDVIGLDKNDAIFVLKKNRLEPSLGGSRFSSEATLDIILRTDPEPGRKVKAGRKILYILNSGQEQIMLPEIVDLFPDQANDLLVASSIILNPISAEFSTSHREGTIISTNPKAGEYLQRNSTVDIIISKGFPVEITSKKITEGDNKALVNVSLQVLPEEIIKKTNIKIVSISKRSPKTLFDEDIPSGKELFFEFEEQLGNRIDVFYNDTLAKSSIVIF